MRADTAHFAPRGTISRGTRKGSAMVIAGPSSAVLTGCAVLFCGFAAGAASGEPGGSGARERVPRW